MGENHLIEVKMVKDTPMDNSEGSTGLLFKNRTFDAKKLITTSIMVTAVTSLAKAVASDVIQNFNHIGDYTGNLQLQNQVNDIRKNASNFFSFATNPIGYSQQRKWELRDYNLQISKQNESADYLRKTLLVSLNKGGTKL